MGPAAYGKFIGPPPVTLDIALAGSGVGNVSATGIDCGDGGVDCMETYHIIGTIVELAATPDSISEFLNWGDDCTGMLPETSIDIVANSLCTANFGLRDFTLDVAIEGPGGGTITSTPGDIDCPGNCTNIFQATTDIGLTAVPDAVSLFGQWNDDCSGADPSTNIELLMDSVCTAQFDFKELKLSIFPAGVNAVNTLTVKNASPGGKVRFYYGFSKGKFLIPGGVCARENLRIKNAVFIGTSTAGAMGKATTGFYIPVHFSPGPIYIRAVDISTCRLSKRKRVALPPG